MRSASREHTRALAAELRGPGFVRFEPSLTPTENGALEALRAEADVLPPDPYDENGVRFRRYGRAILDPERREFVWARDAVGPDGRSVCWYWQASKNPEFENVTRCFPALTETMKENVLLRRQIERDFELTWWGGDDVGRPLQVGVHVIRFSPTASHDAVATPNALHRDGEPYTAAHLISRENVEGGTNWIAAPDTEGAQPAEVPDKVLASFDLEVAFQSYMVRDAVVSHHVDPMRRADPALQASRVILLIDFSPLYPRLEA